MKKETMAEMFQFHFGAICRSDVDIEAYNDYKFQFHFGAICSLTR